MKQSSLFGLLLVLLLSAPAQAQTLTPGFSDLLEQQGFVVMSKRYTWLGRVAVYVSNGVYEREILLARGSNQILQDNWSLIEPDPANVSPGQPGTSRGASSNGSGSGEAGSGSGAGSQGGSGASGNGSGSQP